MSRPTRSYRVEMSCRYTAHVDAYNEDQALLEAHKMARWDAEWDLNNVEITRGEPDPPQLPDADWVPEPMRARILESAARGWNAPDTPLFVATMCGARWLSNGHWALRLPSFVTAPPNVTVRDAAHLECEMLAATSAVHRDASESEDGLASVYSLDPHWPIDAVYTDMLEACTGATTWTVCADTPSSAAVLRDADGAAVALLMPRRPS